MITLVMWEALAGALVYSCFCRASFTSKANTKRDIRWAFTILGVVSILCIVSPLWGYRPDWLVILMTSATGRQLPAVPGAGIGGRETGQDRAMRCQHQAAVYGQTGTGYLGACINQ